MPLLTMKQIMADSVKRATTDVNPEERYAVGAFNFSTLEEMVGIVEGAKEKNVTGYSDGFFGRCQIL
ncbi:MAG: hypothetical protein QM793_13005 [Muricomes sp.]